MTLALRIMLQGLLIFSLGLNCVESLSANFYPLFQDKYRSPTPKTPRTQRKGTCWL